MDLTVPASIAYLQSPQAVRDRCEQIFAWVEQGHSLHFRCDLSQLRPTATYVSQIAREAYPGGTIPFHSRWRHVEIDGIDRVGTLKQALQTLTDYERAGALWDLAVVSVLLDAGAGPRWEYQEPGTGYVYRRSEGLAVASWHGFCQGLFCSRPHHSYQVDADGLASLTLADLADAFQVSEANPLVGLEGRLDLMHRLAQALRRQPNLFGDPPRPGHLIPYLVQEGRRVSVPQILTTLLHSLGEIWPGRVSVQGVPLGDVWPHRALPADPPGANLVPFHKLSQWLTYSLLEPLQDLGITLVGLDQLTGLAEYRNGGLCLDLGLIRPQHDEITTRSHPPESEIIVEWRALTIALLDRIAEQVRAQLNRSAADLPLVTVLQGGTWAAGRRLAAEKRGGEPPIQLKSDGTVF